MVKWIFMDVETIPPDKSAPYVRDKIPQGEEEEYRKLALDPEYARILCLGLIVEQDGYVIHRGTLGRDKNSLQFHLDEARTLKAFWNLVRDFNPSRDLFIGWNILDFDMHLLMMRSVIHQVKPTVELRFTRFRDRPIFDVMWEFEHWRRRLSLDEAARILGMTSSKIDGVDGSKVYDLFLGGRYQDICDYCMRDTELTRKLFYRINFLQEPGSK